MMRNAKKYLLLADCKEEEVVALGETLHYNGKSFVIKSHIANWKRTGKRSELKRYGMYFAVAFRYFLRRKDCGMIVGWQQFYALIFCFFCNIFSVQKTTIVMALNFTYKNKTGKLAKIYRWFMGKCVNPVYLDYIHVPSSDYAELIHREFDFPRERILVVPFGVEDSYETLHTLAPPAGFQKENYALAIGRSNRDYDFLIRAWKDVDFPLVIISDTYKGCAEAENITLLTNVAGEESLPWIANCGLMVIPIDDGTVCSGDTVLLTAMSLGRKIVVTVPSTLSQMYVTEGENAVLAEKNEESFRRILEELLHGERYSGLGAGARNSFVSRYTRKSMGMQLTRALAETQTR